VSAFGDPGAARLAQRAPCPVIGIGAAAARQAAQAGQPFAVATTTAALAAPIDALMMAHAGNATYVGCFCADADPAALMSNQGALDAALLAQINRAYAAGAACVIIGGGPLGTAAERLRAASPVPLINPILSAARALRLLIESEHA
jgi:allantoin racemase